MILPRRGTLSGRYLSLFLFSVSIWSLAGALEAAAIGIPAKIFLSKVSYVGILSSPVLLLYLALGYTHSDGNFPHLRRGWLWILPGVTFGLVATNEHHGLIWNNFTPLPAGNILLYGHGPWFWVNAGYSYLLVCGAVVLLAGAALHNRSIYRLQAMGLFLATPWPWLGNFLYIFNLSPFPGRDLTPLGFTITGLILALDIYQYQLADLLPVARDRLVESLRDGLLVLDAHDRILDINPAALGLFGQPAEALLGKVAGCVLPELAAFLAQAPADTSTEARISLPEKGPCFLDVRTSTLADWRGRFYGRLVVLRDISIRRLAEEALKRSEENFRKLFDANPVPVLLTRRSDSQIIRANQAAQDFFAMELDDLLSTRALSFYANPEERKRLIATIEEQGSLDGQTVEVKTVSGELRWIQTNAYPVEFYGESCLMVGWVDITEHKLAEQQMVQVNQELEGAILNANNYAALAEMRAQEADTMRGAGAVVVASLDPDEIIRRILDQLAHVVPYDSAWVQLREADQLVVVGGRGDGNSAGQPGRAFPIQGQHLEAAVIQAGRPLILDGNPQGARPLLIGDHTRSWMGVPLSVHRQVTGLLTLESDQSDHFQSHHASLASAFADQVAIALENARLFAETNQRAGQLATLNRIGLALTAGLELDVVVRTLYEQCSQVMPAESFYVALFDRAAERITFPLFLDRGAPVNMEPQDFQTRFGLTAYIIRARQTLYLPDTLDPETAAGYPIIRAGDRPTCTFLGVPMILRDQVVGVISAQSYRKNAYSPDQIHLLETIAAQAAFAIENARLFSETQRLATIDGLTGIYNRRHLFDLAVREFERAARYVRPLSLILLDIDHFKYVNDTYGHPVGDQALRLLSGRIQANLREVDIFGRYGGEEFMILLPEIQLEDAFVVGERLRQEIAGMQIDTPVCGLSITASFGVASLDLRVDWSLDSLIQRADEALYMAKDAGRDRVCRQAPVEAAAIRSPAPRANAAES